MQTIEELVDELGIEEMTPTRFENERARLAKKFYMVYGVLAYDEIDELIRENEVRMDELVQEWINLHALSPYIQRESRPPKDAKATASQNQSRETGSFYFRRSGRDRVKN
jgi:hypothetical protein